jgi:hypothetical protein
VTADDVEKGGVDVERPQPGFDLITKRHGPEGPQDAGKRA